MNRTSKSIVNAADYADHRRTRRPRSNQLSDFILGAQDGLVSILGLVLGLAASTSNSRVILAGGFATAFAETISMAAVAYTSNVAKRDLYRAELNRETEEIQTIPKIEEEEVREIYRDKGFKGEVLESITQHVVADRELWLTTMMREELGMQYIKPAAIFSATWTVGLSTLIGALIPVSPFILFGVRGALVISIFLTALVMGGIGIYKAKTTVGRPWVNAVKMIIIALGAAFAGYLIGLAFRT